MDGQTREGEAFGLKPNQRVRHGWASRRPKERERMSQLIPEWARLPRVFVYAGWLHRLDDMMGIVGCGFGTYTRQYE
jgi:hypothetical protein